MRKGVGGQRGLARRDPSKAERKKPTKTARISRAKPLKSLEKSSKKRGSPEKRKARKSKPARGHRRPHRNACFFPRFRGPTEPKGPFRTKNTTAIAKIVNYYAVLFSLRPPNLVRRGPFLVRKNVCNSQETGVRTRRAAIVNHPAVLRILRVVNLLRVVFLVRRGPLGSFCPRTSAGIPAWTSAGFPAPKLTLWAAFFVLESLV